MHAATDRDHVGVVMFFGRGYIANFLFEGGDPLIAGILGVLVVAVLVVHTQVMVVVLVVLVVPEVRVAPVVRAVLVVRLGDLGDVRPFPVQPGAGAGGLFGP